MEDRIKADKGKGRVAAESRRITIVGTNGQDATSTTAKHKAIQKNIDSQTKTNTTTNAGTGNCVKEVVVVLVILLEAYILGIPGAKLV